jgi:hypothetical protein
MTGLPAKPLVSRGYNRLMVVSRAIWEQAAIAKITGQGPRFCGPGEREIANLLAARNFQPKEIKGAKGTP